MNVIILDYESFYNYQVIKSIITKKSSCRHIPYDIQHSNNNSSSYDDIDRHIKCSKCNEQIKVSLSRRFFLEYIIYERSIKNILCSYKHLFSLIINKRKQIYTMYLHTITNNSELMTFCKIIALNFGFTVCGFSAVSNLAESLSLMYDGYRSHNDYELENYVDYIMSIFKKTKVLCNKYKQYLQNFFEITETFQVNNNLFIRDKEYNRGFVWLSITHRSSTINVFFNDTKSSLNTSLTTIDNITHTRSSDKHYLSKIDTELIEMYMTNGKRPTKNDKSYNLSSNFMNELYNKKILFKRELDFFFDTRYLNIQHFIQMYFEYTIFMKNGWTINGLEPIKFMNAFCIPITEHEYVENIIEYTGLIHDVASIISDYVGGNSSEIDYRFITNVERYSKTCSSNCLQSDVVLRYNCCEQLQCFRHAFKHFTKNNFVNYRNIQNITDCTHTILYFTNYDDD